MALTAVGCKCNRWTAGIQLLFLLSLHWFKCWLQRGSDSCDKREGKVLFGIYQICWGSLPGTNRHLYALGWEQRTSRILCSWEGRSFASLFLFLGRNLSGKAACTSSLKKGYSSGCSFWWVLPLLSYSVEGLQGEAVVKVCSFCVLMMETSSHNWMLIPRWWLLIVMDRVTVAVLSVRALSLEIESFIRITNFISSLVNNSFNK